MYAADPGNVFDSDAHRRVMANLPNPDQEPLNVSDLLVERIAKDDHLNFDGETVDQEASIFEVLQDLEADGYAHQAEGGWQNTSVGFAKLTDKETE